MTKYGWRLTFFEIWQPKYEIYKLSKIYDRPKRLVRVFTTTISYRRGAPMPCRAGSSMLPFHSNLTCCNFVRPPPLCPRQARGRYKPQVLPRMDLAAMMSVRLTPKLSGILKFDQERPAGSVGGGSIEISAPSNADSSKQRCETIRILGTYGNEELPRNFRFGMAAAPGS